ncbi:hypothetical protein HDV02_003158 [Globomyces sp. JEL0801]|nr:hypothetical protein HDV02_003158 [Globomyces sp. JEL0801]
MCYIIALAISLTSPHYFENIVPLADRTSSSMVIWEWIRLIFVFIIQSLIFIFTLSYYHMINSKYTATKNLSIEGWDETFGIQEEFNSQAQSYNETYPLSVTGPPPRIVTVKPEGDSVKSETVQHSPDLEGETRVNETDWCHSPNHSPIRDRTHSPTVESIHSPIRRCSSPNAQNTQTIHSTVRESDNVMQTHKDLHTKHSHITALVNPNTHKISTSNSSDSITNKTSLQSLAGSSPCTPTQVNFQTESPNIQQTTPSKANEFIDMSPLEDLHQPQLDMNNAAPSVHTIITTIELQEGDSSQSESESIRILPEESKSYQGAVDINSAPIDDSQTSFYTAQNSLPNESQLSQSYYTAQDSSPVDDSQDSLDIGQVSIGNELLTYPQFSLPNEELQLSSSYEPSERSFKSDHTPTRQPTATSLNSFEAPQQPPTNKHILHQKFQHQEPIGSMDSYHTAIDESESSQQNIQTATNKRILHQRFQHQESMDSYHTAIGDLEPYQQSKMLTLSPEKQPESL